MIYEQLLDFVQNRMKMSHVYQPVMLMTLLRGRAELNACHRLLEQVKEAIEQADTSVEGFNFGINDGAAAGQKVFHRHVHLVPRRNGDVDDPTGGVRNVIPVRVSHVTEAVAKLFDNQPRVVVKRQLYTDHPTTRRTAQLTGRSRRND